MIDRVSAGALALNYQERSAGLTLTTSDDGGATPPAWANYVIVDADARFVVAMDVVTGGSAGAVGHVYGAGSWLLPITRTTGGTGKVHLCAVTGTVSAFRSWAR